MAKTKSHKSDKSKPIKKSRQPISQKHGIWISLGILTGVTILAMSPLFSAGFVDIDDRRLLLDKAYLFENMRWHIYDYSFKSPHYKPITYLTWMFEYRSAGPNPFVFHFNNILLHVLNTILVFFLIRNIAAKFEKLKGHELPIAFFTALLFGVHPMHVESVGWVVERKDVLYTFFYLLGVWGYVRYLNKGKPLPLMLSALAYFLSVMSKAPGITMLPMLFLLDFVWRRKLSTRLFIEKLGHVGVFAFALYAFGVIGRSGGEGSAAAVLNEVRLARAENIAEHSSLYGKAVLAALRTCLWYVHSLIPIRLSLGYPREQIIGFFGPFIHVFPWLLMCAGGLLVWFSRRFPLLFFAHAFFFIALGPAILRHDMGVGIFMSDRYVYLSVLGLIFLGVAWIWTAREKGWFKENVKKGILISLCVIAGILSFVESHVWKNPETLWTNVIRKYPSVDYAWINRASYYREQGQYDRALADATKGIEINESANGRVQRGLIYRQMGNAQAALAEYDMALKLEKENAQALTNRGNVYLDLGRFELAIADYEKVLNQKPRNVTTRVNMAIAYAELKNFTKAEEEFALAEKDGSDYAELFVNRAIMYFALKEYAKALVDYQRYLEINPHDHLIYNDIGVVHSLMGNQQKAIDSFTKAIDISPMKEYYRLRAQVYDKLGNTAAAEQDRRMAE